MTRRKAAMTCSGNPQYIMDGTGCKKYYRPGTWHKIFYRLHQQTGNQQTDSDLNHPPGLFPYQKKQHQCDHDKSIADIGKHREEIVEHFIMKKNKKEKTIRIADEKTKKGKKNKKKDVSNEIGWIPV